jgi:hypothetical protein
MAQQQASLATLPLLALAAGRVLAALAAAG